MYQLFFYFIIYLLFKKMVKKLNILAATIKTLYENHVRPIDIAKKLKISKQRVNYWIKTPIKLEQYRKKKLDDDKINKIVSLAENKTTSSMSCRKIALMMNEDFKKENLNLKISKDSVNRYLKAALGRPRRIRKVFHLNKKQKKQRVQFCEDILKKEIDGKNIFFTDETQIKTGAFIKDSIRLSRDNQQKLKEGNPEAFKLINRPEKKFENAIMVAGGICSYGLSQLILVETTVNEFAYAQALLFFKEDIENFKKKFNCDLVFEQDGATPHTSQSNKNLITQLFGEDSFIQNPPNSPDLAYPIENLWAYLKPRIKVRDPKNIDELKKITIQEWNKIPKKIIQKSGLSYLKRVKKIIEIGGERLEPYHLNEIKKEVEEEIGELEESLDNEEIGEKNKDNKLKMKIIYNDKRLGIVKKKEVAQLRKKIKEIKENYNKDKKELGKIKSKELKMMSVARAESIYEQKKNLKGNKEKKIEEIEKKINDIGNMEITEYLRYTKEEEKKRIKKKRQKDDDNDDSTIDDTIAKILKIREFENENENIKYEIEF